MNYSFFLEQGKEWIPFYKSSYGNELFLYFTKKKKQSELLIGQPMLT